MIYRKLSEVAPSSASISKPAPNDTVWHLTLDQIKSGSGSVEGRIHGLASEAGSSTFIFDTGNVLYSKLRPYLNKVICPDTAGIATTELVALRPDGNVLTREYLCYYLRSPEFVSWATAQADGAKMPRMKMKSFWAHEIPLPPLEDQIRIAHLLGKVEGLIAQRKQHLQQLDDLLKSVFLEMFGPSSLGYESWPLAIISDLAARQKGAMRTGPFGSSLLHSEFTTEGDVAVLGIDNAVKNRFEWSERRFISYKKYEELERYRVFPGDVIVTIMGTIGRSAVVPDDVPLAINTKHLAAITLDREIVNPLFLAYSIHSSPYILNQFKSKNRGAIMNGLNLGIIKETKLKRPPIELQNKFAGIHSYVDALKVKYLHSLTELENLYGALSQQAFKGELDLSNVPMPNIQPQEGSSVTKGSIAVDDSVDLINTDNLLDLSDGSELRRSLIAQWLDAYREQLDSDLFSVEKFVAKAQSQLAVQNSETDFELVADDYETIKSWVFDALAAGSLTQQLNEESNSIELKAATK